MPTKKTSEEGKQKAGFDWAANKAVIATVVVVLAIVGVFYWQKAEGKQYWAVYTSTGDIYFGKMAMWPRWAMTNVYLLRATGDQSNPFALNRFDQSVWKPEDRIYLNDEMVVWKARISSSSQLNQLFQDPSKFGQVPAGSGEGAGTSPIQEQKQ